MLDPTKAATYQQFRRPDSSFHRDKYARITRRIPNRKRLTVVEVGSGTGIYTKFLVNDFGRVIATDIDPAMAAQARKEFPQAEVKVADGTRMPFTDGSVDVVFGVSVLHHIADRNAVFREAARVLRPGGYVVFCEPNQLNPMTALCQLWYREPALTTGMLKRYCKNAGLRIVELGTTLLRSPSITRITDHIPGFPFVERLAETAHLGVSVYVVAQNES
jgi:ubiquinone/menaquinone biosynthesis C-methylase UbiE